MVRYRMPSSTPSVGSDAPIPETPEDDPRPINLQIPRGVKAGNSLEVPPRAKQGVWVLFVGNLHPSVVEKDLFRLFKPFLKKAGGGIGNITIRTTRGCGVPIAPQETVAEDDRCYATVSFPKFAPIKEALDFFREKPQTLHGLGVTVTTSAAGLPDRKAITDRVLWPKTETGPTTRRIAAEKTELVIEDRQRPLAGPSRTSPQQKPRHNPLVR